MYRTPVWVWGVLLMLLTIGLHQTRNRTVSRAAVSLLPALMLVLSFFSLLSTFGFSALAMACWLAGVGGVGGVGGIAGPGGKLLISPETRLVTAKNMYYVPGSWLPLAAMMALFACKYTASVLLARQIPIAATAGFMAITSLLYGLFSGIFLARAIAIHRSGRRSAAIS